ncbi:hypothetical protein [Novosphingobium sp.]|uniref:hypothetical protein n=1 Tax=Novosphingobium sp. TaxID=1874826 RepID=UPI0025E77079|nr:hypothetical protein [Novosphingobium sp.]
MNRPLVLTSEAARHPFRRSLPAHVLRAMPSFEPEVIAAQERAEAKSALRSPNVDPRALTRADGKDFLLAFVSGFVAFSLWLA